MARLKSRKANKARRSSRSSWKTIQPTPHSGIGYGRKMSIAFALTSFLTVLFLIAMVALAWGGAFSDYTRANVEETANAVASKLADVYDKQGDWSPEAISGVTNSNTVASGMGIQVVDIVGAVVYDDTWPSTDGILLQNTVSEAPTDPESYVTVPVTSKKHGVIGEVRMWVIGSESLLTKADTEFQERTISTAIAAAFIAVAVSIVAGALVSRLFTRPVRAVTDAAQRIREGDLGARTMMRGDDEISRLGETFDEMASKLEHEIAHERRLTSDVAHELRTPLMAMQATIEAMQDGVYPTDAEHLETIAAETRRLARLVQQTLDLSRQETHTAPLRLDSVDIVQLLNTVVDKQQQLFLSKGLNLRLVDETHGKSLIIPCDADMITQCVINLLSNALRYTPEDGWVTVTVAYDRKNVMISVSDNGIGIAEEDLAHIFGRFWRADASRAREAGGLGVGLAVTKQIVERHHGYISVESELEKGSTFTIMLPRKIEQLPPPSSKSRLRSLL